MIKPMIAEIIVKTKTPAAAVSLAIFAYGFISSVTRSTKFSIAVLKNSAIKTRPIKTRHIRNSI